MALSHAQVLKVFGALTSVEQRLLKSCSSGGVTKVSLKLPSSKNPNNSVRAEFLRFLLVGGGKSGLIHERGLILVGAFITGVLDLTAARVDRPICIWRSKFERAPRFRHANVDGFVELQGCEFPGIEAHKLSISGNFRLSRIRSFGTIDCSAMKVGGQLSFKGAEILGRDSCAIKAFAAEIEGAVFLDSGFKANGEVDFLGARVNGQFCCSGATFEGVKADALTLSRAFFGGDVFLNDSLQANGCIGIVGAKINGSLFCADGRFSNDGDAIDATDVVIKENFYLNGSFESKGVVRMLGAQIGGQLNCSGGTFWPAEGESLAADGMTVKGDVFLDDGFKSYGMVRFIGAHIAGDFRCEDGSFLCPNGIGVALSLANSTVSGKVCLSDGFTSNGQVRLVGANIGGNISFEDGEFRCGDSLSLDAEGMMVERGIIFRKLRTPVENISFIGVRAGSLEDDKESWGVGLRLNGFTYGFLANGAPTKASIRLEWLNKQHVFSSEDAQDIGLSFFRQPFRQVQKVLEEMGHFEEAKEVGIEFEKKLRASGSIGQLPNSWPAVVRNVATPISRGMHACYGALTGYGYRPIQILLWFILWWFACGAVYWYAAVQKAVFAPSDPLVFQNEEYLSCRPDSEKARGNEALSEGLQQHDSSAREKLERHGNWYLCETLRGEYTGFSPISYSLDVLLPLVDLHQEKDWAPIIPTPKSKYFDELTSFTFNHFVRLLIWIETIVGWVLSLVLVAMVSGLSRREI